MANPLKACNWIWLLALMTTADGHACHPLSGLLIALWPSCMRAICLALRFEHAHGPNYSSQTTQGKQEHVAHRMWLSINDCALH